MYGLFEHKKWTVYDILRMVYFMNLQIELHSLLKCKLSLYMLICIKALLVLTLQDYICLVLADGNASLVIQSYNVPSLCFKTYIAPSINMATLASGLPHSASTFSTLTRSKVLTLA